MPGYLPIIKKDNRLNLDTFLDDIKDSKDKDFFRPTGVQVYTGMQGSGKTASAVRHSIHLKFRYPKAILVTNLKVLILEKVTFTNREDLLNKLANFDTEKQYLFFNTMDELALVLQFVNNAKYGVIYLIDEIHTYFNALDSKNIPPYVFAEIAQQRKQRKCIIATSQLFTRIAKPFREQVDNVIVCHTWMGVFTTQVAYDGATLDQTYAGDYTHGKARKHGWFIQTRALRSAYDTYQTIKPGQVEYNTDRPTVIQAPKKTGLLKK